MYTFVVGIDVSKKTIDASLVCYGTKQHWHDAFLNKLLGFQQLNKWINTHVPESEQVFICMEHTGHYGQKLCDYLKAEQFDLSLINPLKIKRSLGLRREKSDRSDSLDIATYGLKFQDEIQVNNLTDGVFLDLQLLLAHRRRLQDKMLAFQRQEKYLEHCLTGTYAKMIVKSLQENRSYLKRQLRTLEDQTDAFISEHTDLYRNYELLMSIPGIGRIIALHTLLYTKNFEAIVTARKFACYCGVAPFKNESGSSVRKGNRVSFYANRTMKCILNFGAMNAVRIDPQLKAYYQRKVEEKKSKMLVLNAVRNKLIHRMFAVVRRGTPYVMQLQ